MECTESVVHCFCSSSKMCKKVTNTFLNHNLRLLLLGKSGDNKLSNGEKCYSININQINVSINRWNTKNVYRF